MKKEDQELYNDAINRLTEMIDSEEKEGPLPEFYSLLLYLKNEDKWCIPISPNDKHAVQATSDVEKIRQGFALEIFTTIHKARWFAMLSENVNLYIVNGGINPLEMSDKFIGDGMIKLPFQISAQVTSGGIQPVVFCDASIKERTTFDITEYVLEGLEDIYPNYRVNLEKEYFKYKNETEGKEESDD